MDYQDRLLAQRKAIAAFAGVAVRSSDLGEVLRSACETAAAGLGQAHAKVVERRAGSPQLYVREQIGFDVRDGERWIEPDHGSSAGYALMRGEPVLTRRVDGDERFTVADFVRRARVRSLLNVPIGDPDGSTSGFEDGLWGVIEVDAPEPDAFRADEVEFLTVHAELIAGAIGRDRARRREEALADRTSELLQELQHRIKNNLSVILAAVRLTQKGTSPETREHLDSVAQRVESLALVHDHLYRRYAQQTVNLDAFLAELAGNLADFHEAARHRIEIACDMIPMTVDADRAVSLGQIVAEFLGNSFNYAFPDGRAGTVELRLERTGDAHRLTLRDDGVGLDDNQRAGGTGLAIMTALARQAGGEPEWRSEGGTELCIVLPAR